jgi:hypothetical protein
LGECPKESMHPWKWESRQCPGWAGGSVAGVASVVVGTASGLDGVAGEESIAPVAVVARADGDVSPG